MIKTNGAMFKEFMNDNSVWREGAYFDDDVIITRRNSKQFQVYLELLVDLDTLNDDDEVKIYGGTYYEDSTKKAQPIINVFNYWLKSRNKVKVLVEIDKDKLSLLKEYILSIGGKTLN